MAAGRQGLAAQKASLAGTTVSEQTPETGSPVASSGSGLERPSGMSLAKLPAWPLAQSVAAHALPHHDQNPSQSPHTATARGQQTASSSEEHMHADKSRSPASQSGQQQCEEKGCGALLTTLSINRGDGAEGTQETRMQGSAAPNLAQDDVDADVASTAGRPCAEDCNADLPAGRGRRDSNLQQAGSTTEGAVPSGPLEQTAALVGAQHERHQKEGDEALADNVEAPAVSVGTAHDLRDCATTSEELIGRELYIRASLLNHSCRPNCVVIRGLSSGSVQTLRDIKVSRGHSCTSVLFGYQIPEWTSIC